jgi:cysteinyl-tRNA synthetase
MLKIYNTLTRQLDALPESGKLNMFVCGPTVYDFAHIGNFRSFTTFDSFAKYLRYRGYQLSYLQNITDIDDKIIRRSQEEHVDPLDFAKRYTEEFMADVKSMGITSVDTYAPATDYIQAIINQVQVLVDKGYGYEISDGIYFDLTKFADYGKLSRRKIGQEDDGVSRIDENPEKRNPGDFCLWKRSKPGEPTWPSPWGEGRPGWHIEDTAIAEEFFGPQYDIHGGGQDLMFPHHEAEIAQMEASSDKIPFVKYWMHSAFITTKGSKMGKSLGNFRTVRDLLTEYSSEVLRFYILSAHYRSPLDFSEKILGQAEAATQRLAEFTLKLSKASGDANVSITATKEAFIEALDNDFNVPEAMGHVFTFIRAHNAGASTGSISNASAKEILAFFQEINSILGVIPTEITSIPKEIQNLIDQREKAREAKDFATSDQLRDQLATQDYQIDDTPYGPLVKKK